jgi:hypothetical protein
MNLYDNLYALVLCHFLKKNCRLQQKKKLIRITTVPNALAYPLRGQSSYMHTHGFDVTMVSSDGKDLKVALEQEICPHHIIHMTRKITPFQDLVSLFTIIRFFFKT